MKPQPLSGWKIRDGRLFMLWGEHMDKEESVSDETEELWRDVKETVEMLKKEIEEADTEILSKTGMNLFVNSKIKQLFGRILYKEEAQL